MTDLHQNMTGTRASPADAPPTDTLGDVPKPIDVNDALQQTWSSLQTQVPDLPDAEVRVVPGQRAAACVTDWTTRPTTVMVARGLLADPEEALGFLLHQAAHALVRGGVTSAAHGRWHTRAYRLAAERLGLRVTGHANSVTALHEGQLRYDEELRLLRSIRQPTVTGPRKTRQTQVAATCACVPPKHIRAMPSTLARGTVICTDCGQPFTAVEPA